MSLKFRVKGPLRALSFALVAAGVTLSTGVEARQLTYATYLPPTHPTSQDGIVKFIDIVEKKTDGKVEFAFYPSEAAASAKTMLSAINDQLIDAGFIVSVYFPTSLPVNTVLSDLSFFNSDNAVTAAAVTDTILNDCPQCMDEYKSYNVHFLATYSTPPYQAMCKQPMTDGFDPKGLRMRAPGAEVGRWVTQIGGVPINIPNNESYEAMERGQVDCVIGAVSWLKSLSLGEVAHSVATLPMGGFQGGSLFNISQDVWEGLDAKTQAIMQDAALQALASTVYSYTAEEKEARVTANKNGMNFVDASPALVEQRDAFMKSQIAQAAKTASSRGVDNAEAIVQAFQKNLAKWKPLIEGKNLSEQQYYELLKTHLLADAS
ncbi:C4-dicarboxylate TRAP transporter substrate-binding protein [Salinisphaera aquimarina]|uniref:C4-dicarboxylate TRAP transporter substrate-binding protein n=1 Tax=Salinisphaera aquimarina TaxID=2094031 RepID=A0ABV7EKU2_9GAMM